MDVYFSSAMCITVIDVIQTAAYLCFRGDYRGLIKRVTKIYGRSEKPHRKRGFFRKSQNCARSQKKGQKSRKSLFPKNPLICPEKHHREYHQRGMHRQQVRSSETSSQSIREPRHLTTRNAGEAECTLSFTLRVQSEEDVCSLPLQKRKR
jgi:hypothetical protein